MSTSPVSLVMKAVKHSHFQHNTFNCLSSLGCSTVLKHIQTNNFKSYNTNIQYNKIRYKIWLQVEKSITKLTVMYFAVKYIFLLWNRIGQDYVKDTVLVPTRVTGTTNSPGWLGRSAGGARWPSPSTGPQQDQQQHLCTRPEGGDSGERRTHLWKWPSRLLSLCTFVPLSSEKN